MRCTELKEHFFEVMAGETVSPDVSSHLSSCATCAQEMESMQKTMSLLDEWQAPADTSPYFMTRLRARMRDEGQTVSASWLNWFRRPALAVGMAVLLVASISLFRSGSVTPTVTPTAGHQAVADLQYLDKNSEVLQDFDLLDDIQGDNATANR